MSVKSMFEYKFPASAQQEGLKILQTIGKDMSATEGYLSYEIVQDVNDPGHLMGNTQWSTHAQATAVLATYQHDAKIKRATELSASPQGFIGEIVPSSS